MSADDAPGGDGNDEAFEGDDTDGNRSGDANADDRDALLRVSRLEAGYETGQVLFGVDLAISRGELVSLLGRNGAGKSTTFRAIMGAAVPRVFGGEIDFAGTSLLGRRPDEIARSGLGFVPEDRRCFPRLTVAENVRLAINHAANPLSLDAVLSLFPELANMRGKEARNTSGGEQQMLAIARALATNPEMMLLDEPFEGLAPYVVRRIEDIVREINNERNITVLFVEQNAVAAMAVADRHYVLDEGRIVETVSTERLREDADLRQRYLGV
ncbi:ABC transporter ATP-binding protein [Halobacteriales archaeon QS_8_65_32]|nr:MAG: ABC transporter ATP-binding protein [Halobacteriales archaeon QS_8_65_32]